MWERRFDGSKGKVTVFDSLMCFTYRWYMKITQVKLLLILNSQIGTILDMQIVLDVTSNMAALEVGGGPWFNTWKGETRTPEILKRALTTPIDVDQAFKLLPLFKPPGLQPKIITCHVVN